MPDQDLILHMKSFGFGTSYIMGSALYFIIRQMATYIERRKVDLIDKKPGAVLEEGFPKIIWTHMLKRLQNFPLLNKGKTFAMHGKFNLVLEEHLAEGPDNLHLMSTEVQENNFNLTGYLNGTGKTAFWLEVDKGFKKFNMQKIRLLPHSNKRNNSDGRSADNQSREKEWE